jgi:sugar/nucleoside kinase (ribokinase family)
VVLCAGIAVEDFLFRVEKFPEPGEKAYADALVATIGGCAANAAVAVARLGGTARFAGPVGTAAASARFLAALAEMGVDGSGVTQVAGAAISVSGIFIDGTGEKMVATRRGEKLADARPANPATLVEGVDIVIADNRFPDYVHAVCSAARARGVPVVLDVDAATTLDDPLFRFADYLIYSAEALTATTGLSDLGAALTRAAENVRVFLAVTDGPDDVLWMDQGALRRLGVFRIAAVDTLGAGDTFHGGFALALAEGADPVAAMRFGAAAAALKCTRFGGISGTPWRAEVEAFLAQQPAGLR